MYTGCECLYRHEVYTVLVNNELMYVGTELASARFVAGKYCVDVDIWRAGKKIGKHIWSGRLNKWVEI